VASARPADARIHRALEVTLNEVDQELHLCRQLADETHFENCPGLQRKLPHRWNLLPTVHRDIAPRENSCEYIDGAFRPNTARMLELLSGIELYRDPFVAVRELLQNAFDAVREQIAYQRLSEPDPNRAGLEEGLARLHHVELRFETSPDADWLVCTDTGVGMTKAIIRDHLLVSGVARRHDVLALERRCKEAGFPLGRTAQFGIGVLTYFLLADQVVVKTRRSQLPGDADPTGWSFETEGIGSFGELRPDNSRASGTELRLRLRKALVQEPTQFYSALADYVSDTPVHIPCEFRLHSALAGSSPITYSPGWVGPDLSQILLKALPLRWFGPTDLDLLSLTRLQQISAKIQDLQEAHNDAREKLPWTTNEGELPSDLGPYRIHIPYFELPGGLSLVFLRIRQTGRCLLLQPIAGPGARLTYFPPTWACKGMRIGAPGLLPGEVFVQIDLRSNEAGRVSVSRHEFSLTQGGEEAFEWLACETSDQQRRLVLDHASSLFASLNCRLAGIRPPAGAPAYWLSHETIDDVPQSVWAPVGFPATCESLHLVSGLSYVWRGKPVSVLPPVRPYKIVLTNTTWVGSGSPPDTVAFCPLPGCNHVIALWTRNPAARQKSLFLPTAKFPPKWKSLCGAAWYHCGVVWNRTHLLIRAVNEPAFQWAREVFKHSIDPLPHADQLLGLGGHPKPAIEGHLKTGQRS